MHISAAEEYGLRCALQLAKQWPRPLSLPGLDPLHEGARVSSEVTPLAASQIAESEGISVEYVSKFMHFFKKAGLVEAVRGNQGGFRWARPPWQTTLEEVFGAVRPERGSAETEFCGQFSGHQTNCVHIQQCSVRPLWTLLALYFSEVSRGLKLSDLLSSEPQSRDRIQSLVTSKAQELCRAVGESRSGMKPS